MPTLLWLLKKPVEAVHACLGGLLMAGFLMPLLGGRLLSVVWELGIWRANKRKKKALATLDVAGLAAAARGPAGEQAVYIRQRFTGCGGQGTAVQVIAMLSQGYHFPVRCVKCLEQPVRCFGWQVVGETLLG